MDNILYSLFTIILFPFTSGTFFVSIPVLMSFVLAMMALIGRMLRGRM